MRRLRDEDGQALLLALAFLIFFGLVIGTVLWFAEASVRSTTQLRDQRNTVYAADGAMDGAIQYARSHPEAGAFGTFATCSSPGCVPCITYSATVNGKTATVTCESLADPIDQNRYVRFTASVDGVARVTAEVRFLDRTPPPPPVPVDVESWTYLR